MLWLVQSSLFLLLAGAMLLVVRRLGPSVESMACRFVLVGTFVLPIVFFALDAIGVSGPQWVASTHDANSLSSTAPPTNLPPPESIADTDSNQAFEFPSVDEQAEKPMATPPASSITGGHLQRVTLMLGWLSLSTIMLWRLTWSILAVQRLKSAAGVDPGLTAECRRLASKLVCPGPEVRRSAQVSSPCLVGILQPVIIFPLDDSHDNDLVCNILLHELGHVVRRDCWWNLLFKFTLAILPFQPLLWWLARRHEFAAEQSCDDFVVLQGNRPEAYARQLVDLAGQSLCGQPVGVGMVARPSMLAMRIRRIVDERCTRRSTASLQTRLAFAMALIGMCVLTTLVILPASAQTQAPAPSATSPASTSNEKRESTKIRFAGQVLAVDGSPSAQSLVHLEFPYTKLEQTLTTGDGGKFETELDLRPEQLGGLRMMATTKDGSQMFHANVTQADCDQNVVNLKIQLQPTRTIIVSVVAVDGSAVSDANVLLKISPGQNTVVQTTNANGVARLRVAERQAIMQAVAWKDGMGLDYRSYYPDDDQAEDPLAEPPQFPLDSQLTLELAGSRPLEIFVSDTDGQPITDVTFYPWLVRKAGQPELNISMFQEHFLEAPDANGRAVLNWFPRWQGKVSVWPVSETYVDKQWVYDPASGTPLRVTLDRLVEVSGVITKPDSNPAVGMKVRAGGRSYKLEQGDLHGMQLVDLSDHTDSEGRYKLMLPPHHIYMLVVEDNKYAAANYDVFIVQPETPILEKRIPLRVGTRVHGVLTSVATAQPIPNAYVQVTHKGKDLKSAGFNVPMSTSIVGDVDPVVAYGLKTDEQGRFEIMLGDGKFYIGVPRGASREVTIQNESELEVNLQGEAGQVTLLRGRVFMKKNNAVVDNAKVVGEAASERFFDWKTGTNSEGSFLVSRPKQETYVRVLTADGRAGVIEKISAGLKEFDFGLTPTGSVEGRLVSAAGVPLADHAINYALMLPATESGTSVVRFQQSVKTDDEGNFRLTQLVAGHEYTLMDGEVGIQSRVPVITKVTVQPGSHVDLGDQRVP